MVYPVYMAVNLSLSFGGAFLLTWVLTMCTLWAYKCRLLHPRNARGSRIPSGFFGWIPAGTFGWPLIGETLDFANENPLNFVLPRVRKYGSVFKSHIAGYPSIIVTTPDMARFVYSKRNVLKASYPGMISTLIGKKSLSSCNPERHPFLKRIIHSSMLPEVLRREVGRVEAYILEGLNTWIGRTVMTATEMKQLTLTVALHFIFGVTDTGRSSEGQILVEMHRALANAFYVVPINMPGFTWYKAMKIRERGCRYLRALLAQNRKDSEDGKACSSVLRALVDARDLNGMELPDDEIIDLLIGTFFGALDTTATTLTWILKHLTEHPEVLNAVADEQREILRAKNPGESLRWEDTRSMRYTQQVLQETLRYPTVLQFTAREATEDTEYKQHFIPKGWKVFVMTTFLHLDPESHSAPTSFDPSRFKVSPKPGTYLPFGAGAHICPGNEFAKLVILVFVHHFVTKFRWESVLPEMGTEFKPFPLPKGGFPIEVGLQ